MRSTLRSILMGTALFAGGCATHTPQAEPQPKSAPVPASASTAAVPAATVPAPTSTAAVPAPTPQATPASPLAGEAPAAGPPPTGASSVPPARGQTSDERRTALDKRLNDSLGSFDAQLRKEQQQIAQERDARQTSIATVASDGGTSKDADASGSAATEGSGKPPRAHTGTANKRVDVRAERSGDLKSEKTAANRNGAGGGNGAASGNGAVASEIPDGNDDDIVARRLRKAAEQETDPELQEKLWKEYVEYKKNAQGK